MGRHYGGEQQACWDADLPRPKPDPILTDGRTGNAAKDGFTAVGPRRPRSARPGDIMDAEAADRRDDWDKESESYGIMPYSDW